MTRWPIASPVVVLGGVEGDAFQIVRVPTTARAAPETVLSIPEISKFDVDQNGSLYIAIQSSFNS